MGMSQSSFFKRRWKLILNLVTLGALTVLIYLSRGQLADTLKNLGQINGWALLLIIPIEFINYHAQARLYQRLFGIVGNKLSYKFLFKTALELNFVNHVFPSGGVTGISYFGIRMRRGDEISGGKATLVHIMKLGLTFLSFEVLIIFGLLCLAAVGKVNNLTVMVAAMLSTLLIVGTALFIYIVGSKSRINSFFTSLTRFINRLIKVVFKSHPEAINISNARAVFDDFHDNYQQLKSSRKNLYGPFWYAFLANASEVLAVYVVYIAFDKYVNLGAVILAYAVANFAGLVSVLPGGVGIYEALMTAVLASAGVPAGVSIPATVMYRVVNTLVQIPPGYYLYHKALTRGERPAGDLSDAS
jgi:putative heme transporter